MNASSKGILITGGSRGIGLALVETLLAEGYRVATCSRKPSKALDKLLAKHKETSQLNWIEATIGDKSEKKFVEASLEWLGETPYGGL